jgi:hypothetical protein
VNGPPTTSVARITSKSSPGRAFWCLDGEAGRMPLGAARRRAVADLHERGSSTAAAAELAARRWYLNEREKTRPPLGVQGGGDRVALVAVTGLPSKVNVTGGRAGCARRAAGSRLT